MPTMTPNMNLTVPVIGGDSGLTWEQSVNANSATVDAHDHSPGKGVPVTPAGLSINANLPFNNFQATGVQAVQFTSQASLATTGALYVSGVDLYYNDTSGNVVRMTTGGAVNATSSGISSGNATAAFVGSVLVVNADVNKPANIQGASILLGNNVTGSHFLTIAPPNAMAADYGITMPALPASQKIMTLDASGIMSAPYSVDGTTITISANVIGVGTGGIGTTQLASGAVTLAKIATGIQFCTVTTYSTAGTYSFVVPAGATFADATVVSGGGGGGGAARDSIGGTGGQGCCPVFAQLLVTPGETLSIQVGAGGAGGVAGTQGGTGGTSSISRSGTAILTSSGGTGGQFSGIANPSTIDVYGAKTSGGAGNSLTVAFAGGTSSYGQTAGAQGTSNAPGGGGGAGFGAGVTASNGGNSGLGSGSAPLGKGGTGYGAGGGGGQGGSATSGNIGGVGGNGAAGLVRIVVWSN